MPNKNEERRIRATVVVREARNSTPIDVIGSYVTKTGRLSPVLQGLIPAYLGRGLTLEIETEELNEARGEKDKVWRVWFVGPDQKSKILLSTITEEQFVELLDSMSSGQTPAVSLPGGESAHNYWRDDILKEGIFDGLHNVEFERS